MKLGESKTVNGKAWTVVAAERRKTKDGLLPLLVWASGCRTCGGAVIARTSLAGEVNPVMVEAQCAGCINVEIDAVPLDTPDQNMRKHCVTRALEATTEGIRAPHFQKNGELWVFLGHAV